MALSVWFTWGVLEKFAKKETAIRQYEENIEEHPTIAFCGFKPFQYYKKFNITYTTYQSNGLTVQDEVVLKIGENDLENSGGIVHLTTSYTRYTSLCYVMNTTRDVDERETKIKKEKRHLLYLQALLLWVGRVSS